MNQSFSASQLQRYCKRNELLELGITKSELQARLNATAESITAETFEFEFEGRPNYFIVPNSKIEQTLVLRKLNDNLKRLYKDEQSNRRIIIAQLKNLLGESAQMFVLKTDIKKFYESINVQRLLTKVKEDGILSVDSQNLINRIFGDPLFGGLTGLPRGLSISATLSELYMRRFDRWIRRHEGVYFYARYVDDIIVFAVSKGVAESVRDNMNSMLEDGMEYNSAKTDIYTIDQNLRRPLEYLGYKFTVSTNRKKRRKEVDISIADSKVRKMKTRTVKSFLDYVKTGNYGLLINRMQFLTGNFSIRTNPEGQELRAGIHYNYSFLNNLSVLHDLNLFYRKLLYSKTTALGGKLNMRLTTGNRSELSKLSFKHGHVNKVYYNFTPDTINLIKLCW